MLHEEKRCRGVSFQKITHLLHEGDHDKPPPQREASLSLRATTEFPRGNTYFNTLQSNTVKPVSV